MMLRKCIYGGGNNCTRQGGDGSLHHVITYSHPFPNIVEAGQPLGEFVSKSSPIEETYLLNDFVIDFNEEQSAFILSLELSKGIDVNDLLKSLYDFDLDTPEGVSKLMGLVPVLDPVILVDLVEKIWPGYVVEAEDPELLRAEIRGYLLDFLFESV
jgi:hypothetical protein